VKSLCPKLQVGSADFCSKSHEKTKEENWQRDLRPIAEKY
jgi:hypothetical protein